MSCRCGTCTPEPSTNGDGDVDVTPLSARVSVDVTADGGGDGGGCAGPVERLELLFDRLFDLDFTGAARASSAGGFSELRCFPLWVALVVVLWGAWWRARS